MHTNKGGHLMPKPSKGKIIFLLVLAAFLLFQWNTNYDLRYHKFLMQIIDVPGREAVTWVSMSYRANLPRTAIRISVDAKKLQSHEQLEQMLQDILVQIDLHLPPPQDRPLPIHHFTILLGVYDDWKSICGTQGDYLID